MWEQMVRSDFGSEHISPCLGAGSMWKPANVPSGTMKFTLNWSWKPVHLYCMWQEVISSCRAFLLAPWRLKAAGINTMMHRGRRGPCLESNPPDGSSSGDHMTTEDWLAGSAWVSVFLRLNLVHSELGVNTKLQISNRRASMVRPQFKYALLDFAICLDLCSKKNKNKLDMIYDYYYYFLTSHIWTCKEKCFLCWKRCSKCCKYCIF